ncbi:MAG TPA: hypothetical protein VFT55_17100, partial [Planctomycetota bacterium]|nr:hypothetical protein [Planctomycetota bacterium]
MNPLAVRVLFASLVLAAGLSAHGGQYRAASTPMAKSADVAPVSASWQAWWESNKEPFLRRDAPGAATPLTGSDDFYLGRRRAEAVVAVKSTVVDRRSRIVPALAALIERERSRDVQSACLVALGKVGLDAPGIDIEQLLAA